MERKREREKSNREKGRHDANGERRQRVRGWEYPELGTLVGHARGVE